MKYLNNRHLLFTEEVNVLVLSSLSMTRIFYDIETEGLSKSKTLPSSDEFDVATCCTLADIDFDGNQEILIGTYGEQVLVYKQDELGDTERDDMHLAVNEAT